MYDELKSKRIFVQWSNQNSTLFGNIRLLKYYRIFHYLGQYCYSVKYGKILFLPKKEDKETTSHIYLTQE